MRLPVQGPGPVRRGRRRVLLRPRAAGRRARRAARRRLASSASSARREAASRRCCRRACCPRSRPARCRGARAGAGCSFRPGEHPAVELPALGEDERLVIAVDQLEEVFTSCRRASRARRVPADARRRGARPGRTHVVLVALRADFYGRCAAYPEFAALLSANHVLLGPMKRDELVRAIERPGAPAGPAGRARARRRARRRRRRRAGSAAAALDDAARALARAATAGCSRTASYRASGGVHGAVARLAEHAYSAADRRASSRSRARSCCGSPPRTTTASRPAPCTAR